jgi:hypothetical protein
LSTELLYTSAPQGLRHGSRGFCTVLTTAGMPINVISKLEALSSYRHLNQGSDRRAVANPVAYSHQRVALAGQTVSVLSRVADYGTDYSGRTNKLAHHITIDPAEMAAAGPAWVMRQRGLFRTEWLGHCETPSAGPAIPRGDQPPRVCSAWKNVAGDAGWGGVVAEAVASGGGEPLWIVYPLDSHDWILEMIDEAISLLSPAMRWRATFSTFAANIPPDVDCKIRCVPAGTNEARFAISGGKAIDLTRSPAITTASQWVERARGVIRPDRDAPASSGESINVLEEAAEPQAVRSAWSIAAESTEAPPPPPGPPSLPPEVLAVRGRRRSLFVAAAVIGVVTLLGSTWTVARHLAGLPLLPGTDQVPSPSPPVPAVTEIPDRVEEPIEVPAPTETLTFRVSYDRKQLLAWVLDRPEPSSPLPSPIRLRGRLRLPSAPAASDQASQTLVAWGGDAQGFGPPEPLRLETTRLTDAAETLTAERLPYVPAAIDGAAVYWSDATADLIAVIEWQTSQQNFSTDEAVSAEQVAAYRSYAVQLSRLAGLIDAIRRHSDVLPGGLKATAAAFLASWLRVDDEARVRVLMREPSVAANLAADATELSERLQEKAATANDPLTKPEQAALLKVVSLCGRFGRVSDELARAHATLTSGLRVDVPELQFLDADGNTLRQLPIQFHFSL